MITKADVTDNYNHSPPSFFPFSLLVNFFSLPTQSEFSLFPQQPAPYFAKYIPHKRGQQVHTVNRDPLCLLNFCRESSSKRNLLYTIIC